MPDYESRKQKHLEEVARREQEYLAEIKRKEELERLQQEEQLARQRQEQRGQNLAASMAKQAVKKEGKRLAAAGARAAGAWIAESAGAALAAVGWPVILTIVAIILVLALLIGFVVLTLSAICNPDTWSGWATKNASAALAYLGVIEHDYCAYFSGATQATVKVITGAEGLICQNPQLLAQQNNVPATPQNDPDLDKLIACVASSPGVTGNTGEISTFDKANPICNLTRGQTFCSLVCSHTVLSCHYGGATGSTGALAVDFGNERIGDQIIGAAQSCSASLGIPIKRADCETSEGTVISCSLFPAATHVHVSLGKCVGN